MRNGRANFRGNTTYVCYFFFTYFPLTKYPAYLIMSLKIIILIVVQQSTEYISHNLLHKSPIIGESNVTITSQQILLISLDYFLILNS